ncbi:hypothetical protein I4U23_031402 [Adineta vaga]|nr:hypothetical protein I4U23_031402 [Adineta vaga]
MNRLNPSKASTRTSQYYGTGRKRWRDDSPSTVVPGSTPSRTPFELFKKIDQIDRSEKEKDDMISMQIMVISPIILQSIKVKTISCQATLTFQQLVRQQLYPDIEDEMQCDYIVTILVGNTIVTDFDQQLGNTAAIEDDIVVYILFMPLYEIQCTNIPKIVLKPYFNSLTRYGRQAINFFVHYQCPINSSSNRNERIETVWEETTRYWEQIPFSYRLEKIPKRINRKTNNKCYLYHNGNRISLQNKKNKLPQTINEEFNKFGGCDLLLFDVVRDGEIQDIHATTACTHDSRYDYTAFLQLIRLRLETIIWAASSEKIFSRFIDFCDKDKLGELNTRESRTAILTIIRLLRDEDIQQITHDTVFDIRTDWDDHEPTKCAQYLLPIPENAVSVDIHVFRAMLVDALVHYIKITTLKFIRRHDETNMTLPMGNIWLECVEPFLAKIKTTITDKLVELNRKMKILSTSEHIVKFTKNYMIEMLILPVTVYKMVYGYLRKKRNQSQSIAISVLISFLMTVWILITLMNVVLYYHHSKQLKDNEGNEVMTIEVYFPLMLLIYTILLDYVARMFQSVANTRKKLLSVGNSYRAAVYDLIRYQARPIIINRLPNEDENVTFTVNLDPNLERENISISKSTRFRKLFRIEVDRRNIIVGLIIFLLASIHACTPLIAREIVKKKDIDKRNPYPWYAQFIVNSYYIIGFVPFLFFLIMMFRAFECFRNLYNKCYQTLSSGYIEERQIKQSETYMEYLNIKKPYNLEYFLTKLKRILDRSKTTRMHIHLFTVTFGFTICMIFVLISVIQVFSGIPLREFQRDPQSIVILVDLIIMALPVIAILVVVANTNHISMKRLFQLLRRTHVETVRDEELYMEGDNDGSDTFGEVLANTGNALNFLQSTASYVRDVFEIYQIRLYGVFVVDRSLVMKIIFLALSVAGSKAFKLLQEKFVIEPSSVDEDIFSFIKNLQHPCLHLKE